MNYLMKGNKLVEAVLLKSNHLEWNYKVVTTNGLKSMQLLQVISQRKRTSIVQVETRMDHLGIHLYMFQWLTQ
jgi:hypothetical protein